MVHSSGEMRRAFLLVLLPFTSFQPVHSAPTPRAQSFKISLSDRVPSKAPLGRAAAATLGVATSTAQTSGSDPTCCLRFLVWQWLAHGLSFLMPPACNRLCSTWQTKTSPPTFSRLTPHSLLDWLVHARIWQISVLCLLYTRHCPGTGNALGSKNPLS